MYICVYVYLYYVIMYIFIYACMLFWVEIAVNDRDVFELYKFTISNVCLYVYLCVYICI
jgi:hypothetical protein